MLGEITKRLDALDSSSKKRQNGQIVNKCEEALGSDATIEKDVLNTIMKQLNLTKTYLQKLVKDENIRMSSLRRENAIIREAYNSHAGLS
jgi:hypothetical protein